jgi:hypothetical protein
MKLSSTLGGLAGAGALTLLNQGAKKIDKDAPRLDVLGTDAFSKMLKSANVNVKNGSALFGIALAGDLISNSLYYGMTGTGTRQQKIVKGAMLGLTAGLGAVLLAEPLGLDKSTTNKNTKTQVMTVAWYMLGGIIAAAASSLLTKNEPKKMKNKVEETAEKIPEKVQEAFQD